MINSLPFFSFLLSSYLCQTAIPLSNGVSSRVDIEPLSSRMFSIDLPDTLFTVKVELASNVRGFPSQRGSFMPQVRIFQLFHIGDEFSITPSSSSLDENAPEGNTCPLDLPAGQNFFVVENLVQENVTVDVRLTWRDSKLDESLIFEGDFSCNRVSFSVESFTYEIPEDLQSVTIRVRKTSELIFDAKLIIKYDDCPGLAGNMTELLDPEFDADYVVDLMDDQRTDVEINSESTPPLGNGRRMFLSLIRESACVTTGFFQVTICTDGQCREGSPSFTDVDDDGESSNAERLSPFQLAVGAFLLMHAFAVVV